VAEQEPEQLMFKDADLKRRQHYVWKHYLQAWTDGGTLWCSMGGEPFPASPNNIAVGRDFYKLKQMSERDYEIVALLISRFSDPGLVNVATGWLQLFRSIFNVQKLYSLRSKEDESIERTIEAAIQNLEEEIHSRIEVDSAHILAELRLGDVTLFRDPARFDQFALFIAFQYLRTPGILDRLVNGLTTADRLSLNVGASAGVLRVIFSTSLAFGLAKHGGVMRAALLEAPSGTAFITSDQPAINLRATKSGPPPTALNLFYPLSPQRSVLLEFNHPEPSVLTRALTVAEVSFYNEAMAATAHRQLYASNKDLLVTLAGKSPDVPKSE
jgi:hypothetical protein